MQNNNNLINTTDICFNNNEKINENGIDNGIDNGDENGIDNGDENEIDNGNVVDTDLEINLGYPDILFTITLNRTLRKDDTNYLVCKIIIIREIKQINLEDVSLAFPLVKLDGMTIISINKHYDTSYLNTTKNGSIRYIETGYNIFSDNLNDSNVDFFEYNKDCLYILRNGNYYDIKRLFNRINNCRVDIGKGGSQKSHILSPLDFRMSCYLMLLFNFDYKYISYLNTFNDLPKERYLPFIQNQEKKVNNSNLAKNILNRQETIFSSGKVINNFSSVLSYLNKNKTYHTSSKKIQKEDKVNNVSLFSYLDEIDNIILKTNSLFEAQKEIETSWISLMKQKLEDPSVSSWKMLPDLLKKAVSTLEKYESRGILKRRFRTISTYLANNKYEVVLLTIAMLISNYNKISATNISIQLGNNICFLLFKNNIEYENITNLKAKFEEWKKSHDMNSNAKMLKLGDYYINLFTNEPTHIFEFGLDEEDLIDTNCERVIKISPEYVNIIKDSLFVHPTSLPMICEPLEWSDSNYGGFVENRFNQDPINTGSSYHGHRIENKECLYNAINTLNKVKFRINNKLLEYLLNNGSFLLDDEDNNKRSFQNSVTIKIAKIYSKYDFYLNVNCDWRGRIYTNSFFLSYQGGDLSRSLVELSKGEKLTEEGLKYLYIFGANCFSDLLSKRSITYRISWVKNNLLKITQLDKDFINKANKKIQFASFCITMQQYHLDNNYLVKMPIFLDATCSGMQHLAAMLKDVNIGAHVNLLSKTENENVNDLYSNILNPLNDSINKFGKDNPLYSPLANIKLSRKLIKTSIMTQVYSVTVDGIYRQLTSKLKKEKVIHPTEKNKDGKNKYNTFYHVPAKNGKDILISYINLYKIAEIIKNISFDMYPSLKDIYKYFINSVKLMLRLNLPIIWFTPSGLEICQHYYVSEINKVKLTYFGKTRTSVIREWKTIVDKSKQNQSIVPNIIHSLDASHLINVINSGYSQNISPIISIHDCFGTHPNKMNGLANLVRKEFILLYTQHNFLEKYNERVINSIKDNNFEIIEKDGSKYVLLNAIKIKKDGTKIMTKGELILIPEVPKMGDLDLNKIINAIYLIN